MKTFKKECAICGSWFSASSNSAKYCSDACREQGAREHQRDLMRRNRKAIRDEKQSRVVRLPNNHGVKNSAEMMKDYVRPQIDIDMEKARNKHDWFTYYTLYKQRCIENEQEWGYQGVHFVSGIEVHDERFVELMLEKIDE
ncbi:MULTISPECIES: hypothetical protein [Streptococcus]|uniref:hypothetical protein n=1 Tax=Streptococcus TaxID=1301 RepID=UPI000E305410|nr:MULTISPECIES: hypothetical protein [Streptococcus]RFE01171.1 hypothetical protein ADO06_02046 [Streptococcus parauberis]RLU30195.1 hypothetical protein DIY21_09385 [Streptococcus iniae]RLU34652.1 hypothetical protein DIY22_09505 [Streptococcus iniae]RLU35549.1 hypothetical protein DIY19_09505 [Streptococcus iniae]RLU36196.1 hypothetical protein DIY20_09395 [Streptococcus iniae]